jgi:DMSO reductase family type II enzyme heme b subunit
MSLLKHPLLWSAIVLGGLYTVFAYVLNPPIPQALLIWYMSICSVAVLLVVTFDNKTAARFFGPLLALFGAPGMIALRLVAFVGVVAGVGYMTFNAVKPKIVSPVELRTVHPAPPSSLKAYGKTYDLLKLQNPYREQYDEASDEYKEVVAEGAELYYKNCVFCHGDLLDGTGHFAETFTPRPINFQDVGMIAQLQEAFLFWRITKGGPGLPREGTPWASAMPVWEEMLQEDDVWKIISFLYDYTGFEPRSWKLEDKPKEPEVAPVDPNAPLDADAIEAVYMKRCSQCHGEDGDGLGVAADRMYPAPRDFTLGLFKYKTTDADSEFPTDADFRRTIMEGLPGTAMPAWKTLLTDAEVTGLIQLIKEFGGWEEEDPEDLSPIEMGTPPTEVTPELLALGREQFVKACVQCHGDAGRGNITSGKRLKDDAQARIWPRNLTRPETWRWTKTASDVFQRLSAGIPGTPMPEHTSTMSLEDRWAIANYVMTLRETATPLTQGDSVIRGLRVDGDLPDDPADEIWNTAPSMTFAMAPNIIKEPRLFTSLNDMVTVRVLYNDQDIAFRVDMDDRTYSVPGSDLEKAYRLEGVEPTRDAVALQFPAALSGTNEKPYFRLGDKKNPVNLWYWAAPSEEPAAPAIVEIRDAKGQEKPPKPRADSSALAAKGVWKDGQWRVVFKRSLKTDATEDLQFEEGVYTPIAFADWDGLNGEEGLRQAFTAWYWVLLEPEENPNRIMAIAAAAAALAGLLFIGIAIAARRRYNNM